MNEAEIAQEEALDRATLASMARTIGNSTKPVQQEQQAPVEPTEKPMLVRSAAYLGGKSLIDNIDLVLTETALPTRAPVEAIVPISDSLPRDANGMRLGY